MLARQSQLDFYEELHEGLRPRRAFKYPVKDHPGQIDIKGRIAEIQYFKKTTDGEHRYWHPFAEHARPKFGIDEHRNLWIYRGRYVVTTHGIEDLPETQVQNERLPGTPRELTDLGRLEWIKYVDGARTKTIRFPSNPAISRDERGDLHVLQQEKTMAKRSRRTRKFSFENPSRKHGRKRARKHSRHVFHNPIKSNTMETIKNVAILGVVVGGTIIGMEWGANKYNTSRVTAGNQPWSENMIGGLEIAGGLALAAGIAYFAKGSKLGMVAAAGVGAGGVGAGVHRVYAAYQASQLPASNPAVTSPANRASLPAGVPQDYYTRTRQSCAA